MKGKKRRKGEGGRAAGDAISSAFRTRSRANWPIGRAVRFADHLRRFMAVYGVLWHGECLRSRRCLHRCSLFKVDVKFDKSANERGKEGGGESKRKEGGGRERGSGCLRVNFIETHQSKLNENFIETWREMNASSSSASTWRCSTHLSPSLPVSLFHTLIDVSGSAAATGQ